MASAVCDAPGPKKAKWTPEEDEKLRDAVHVHGTESWGRVSSCVPHRSGRQCRERWIGQLAPFVSKGHWTRDEDAILLRHQAMTGNRWTMLAAWLPGRSAVQVKNRWNWLKRHEIGIEQCVTPVPVVFTFSVDVVELRPPRRMLEPMSIDDTLFGAAFQAFRAKMFHHEVILK
jgi:hypothetical protein